MTIKDQENKNIILDILVYDANDEDNDNQMSKTQYTKTLSSPSSVDPIMYVDTWQKRKQTWWWWWWSWPWWQIWVMIMVITWLHLQAKEGPVQPADIQLRIDRPEAETTVEVVSDQKGHFWSGHRSKEHCRANYWSKRPLWRWSLITDHWSKGEL